MKTKSKLNLFFLSILLVNFFLSQTALAATTPTYTYSGVSSQFSQFWCVPSDTAANQGGDLYNCINRIYKFALVFASILGVLYIVVAGYVYISADGSKEAVDKAKSIITTTITALVILFAGFVLLNTINPDLIQFHPIQPLAVNLPNNPVQPYGGSNPSGGKCSPAPSGSEASVANLQNTCFGSNATQASSIANAESNGQASMASLSDVCKDGNSFSLGLFQINIIANGNTIGGPCSNPKSFIQTNGSGTQGTCLKRNASGTCVQYDCQVTNMPQYQSCVSYIENPAKNISVACTLSSNGTNWNPWGANSICKF